MAFPVLLGLPPLAVMSWSSTRTIEMPLIDSFPRELLAEPAEVRMAYFTAKVVAHPRLTAAHQAVRDALRQPSGASLILVHGPTGVGKTTLRLRLEQQLLAEALPDMQHDPDRVPVLAVEAVAPESGQFNWKDYYVRALAALDEPLLEHKVTVTTPENPSPERPVPPRPFIKRSASAAEFRWVLEQCLRRRRVAVCLVDEAQHLKRLTSGRRLLDQMDTLKSRAALTGTVHVLVGTYELIGMTNLSAQLSRRSVEIHFGRYRATRRRIASRSRAWCSRSNATCHWPTSRIWSDAGRRCTRARLAARESAQELAKSVPRVCPGTRRGHIGTSSPGAPSCAHAHTAQPGARDLGRWAALREDPRQRDQLRMLLGLAATPTTFSKSTTNGATTARPASTPPPRRTGQVPRRRP